MANEDFTAYLNGGRSQKFDDYAAGRRVYGGGRSNPTSGPVDKTGYRTRDAQVKSRKNAVMRKLKANKKGNFKSSASLTPLDTTQRREAY